MEQKICISENIICIHFLSLFGVNQTNKTGRKNSKYPCYMYRFMIFELLLRPDSEPLQIHDTYQKLFEGE